MSTDLPVLVIGSGVSGLATARALADGGLPVLVVSKLPIGASNSYLAQGGIAAAIGPGDDPAFHADDTLRVAREIADPARVRILTEGAPAAVAPLISDRVVSRNSADNAHLAQEAGHHFARVVHAADGLTGRAVTTYLVHEARRRPAIRWMDAAVVALASQHGRVIGAYVIRGAMPPEFVAARATVIATGGMAGLYGISSNPAQTSGDGLVLAYRAGATLADLEFIQFHPTVLAKPGGSQPRLLLSEALRGAGAHLLNDDGERIMRDHPAGELAPRDEVAQAVYSQRSVYLSLAHLDAMEIRQHFTGIAEALAPYGWNLTVDPIPVTAGAHFSMGGIVTDAVGRTGVSGLYAVGEAAMVGIHGANRLASNSLLEGLVYGTRVAEEILGDDTASKAPRFSPDPIDLDPFEYWRVPSGLPQALDQHLGVVRHGQALKVFLDHWHPRRHQSHAGLLASLAASAALSRRESRGAHARRDCPASQPTYRGHFFHRRDREVWFEATTIYGEGEDAVSR